MWIVQYFRVKSKKWRSCKASWVCSFSLFLEIRLLSFSHRSSGSLYVAVDITTETLKECCVWSNWQIYEIRWNPEECLLSFVTMNEIRIPDYIFQTKEQSKEWIARWKLTSNKVKTAPSFGQVIVSVFWDSWAVIFTEFLAKGKTINWTVYAFLLDRM